MNDFEDGIEIFRKIKSDEIKSEDAKELKNTFKINLNEISKGIFKSKEQKSSLENIKFLYELRQVVVKLCNKYSSIAYEAKYKTKHGEEILTQNINS